MLRKCIHLNHPKTSQISKHHNITQSRSLYITGNQMKWLRLNEYVNYTFIVWPSVEKCFFFRVGVLRLPLIEYVCSFRKQLCVFELICFVFICRPTRFGFIFSCSSKSQKTIFSSVSDRNAYFSLNQTKFCVNVPIWCLYFNLFLCLTVLLGKKSTRLDLYLLMRLNNCNSYFKRLDRTHSFKLFRMDSLFLSSVLFRYEVESRDRLTDRPNKKSAEFLSAVYELKLDNV